MGRSEEFLGWVAAAMGDRRELAWWDIPRWVTASGLRVARVLTAALVTGLVVAAGTAIAEPRALVWTLGAMIIAGVMSGKFIGPGRLRRTSPPRAMVPARPRSAAAAALLAVAVLTGLPMRAVLRHQWIEPVTGDGTTPDSSYRACRLSTVVDVLACLYTGLPLAVAGLTVDPGVLGWAAVLSWFMALIALDDGKVFPVKLTELILLVRWRHRVNTHRLLEQAVTRGTLRYEGPYYEFTEAAEQNRLAVAWAGNVLARSQRIPDAVAAASMPGSGSSVRPRLLRQLSGKPAKRICLDIAIGVAIVPLTRMLAGGRITGENTAGAVLGLLAGLIIIAALLGVLSWLRRVLGWSLWRIPRVSRQARITALAVASLAADLLVWLAGPGPARHGIDALGVTALPGVLVAVTGGWLCVLARDRWHEATSRVFRHIWDALAAVVTCVTVLVLFDRWLLSVHAAAGVLLPVAIWLSIRAWRSMNDSDRVAIRACADLAVSVLVGGSLAVTLVWLADLLNMPLPEVTALRAVTEDAAVLIDIPWWAWLAVYALLIGASLAFALRPPWLKRAGLGPDRLTALSRRFTKWRLVPGTEVTRRVTSGLHIGLLMILLIGLTGQVAVVPVLRARLADRYTLTLADQERARQELAAFTEIRQEFTSTPPNENALAPLAELVSQINHVGDTPTELDLAQRLGELQASTVATPPAQAQATGPALNGDGDEQLGELDAEEKHDDDAKEQVDRAAELTASAIGQALRIPHIGDATIVQILREYLSGLIEFSPLKDVLAARVVIPEPDKLKDAAVTELAREMQSTPVTDPAAVRRLEAETGVVAAVRLVNQIRYLQEDSGPCPGCAAPAADNGGNDNGSGGDDEHEPPPEVP
jgi:hypothetical protein